MVGIDQRAMGIANKLDRKDLIGITMKSRIVSLLLLLAVAAHGQYQPVPSTQYPALEAILNAKPAFSMGSGAPTGSCVSGKDVYLRSDIVSLYVCVSSGWTLLDTALIPENAANLYFTNARARSVISASAPLAYNSSTGALSIQQASASQSGYLSSTDWSAFNAKAPSTRLISTTSPLQGGGDLTADRTLSLLMWGSGSRPVAANALGTSGNCVQWTAAGVGDAGAPCGSGGGSGYTTVQSNGTSAPQRSTLNLKNGTNVTVSCVDNVSITDCTISASAGAGGYSIIQSNGSSLTPRTTLNFSSEFAAVDNAGASRTDVSINSVGWAKLTGVPTSFAPSAHASTHAAAGSDPVTLSESQITNLTTDLASKVPTSRMVNGHALSADVTVTKSDVGLGNVNNVAQEPALGNPPSDGYLLSSTASGVRSWVAPTSGGNVSTSGTITPTALVTAASSTTIQTPNANAKLDSSGNLTTPGSITTGTGGSAAGYIQLGQGTAPSAGTNSITIFAPSSVSTAYLMQLPAAAGTGFYLGTNSSGTVSMSQVASVGSGSVVLASSAATTVAGQSCPLGGSCSVASTNLSDSTSIVRSPANINLASIGSGILKNTTGTGALSVATAGTDYYAPGTTIASSDLPNPTTAAGGKVRAKDCTGVGHVLSINTDSTVTCSADAGSGGGLGDPGANGVVVRTSAGTSLARTITGTTNRVTITNGDGVSGNPTIDVGSNIVDKTAANTYSAKQTFTPSASAAAINIAGVTANPSTLAEGDIWYRSDLHQICQYQNGAVACQAFGGSGSPLTTKGDIYVYGSGNTRLPVGTDGMVLTADSTQTTGLKWATPSGGGGCTALGSTANTYIPGFSVTPDAYPATNGQNAAFFAPGGANGIGHWKVFIPCSWTPNKLAIYVTAGGSASSCAASIGIYQDSNGNIGNRILYSGVFTGSSSGSHTTVNCDSVGLKIFTSATSPALSGSGLGSQQPPGWYHILWTANDANMKLTAAPDASNFVNLVNAYGSINTVAGNITGSFSPSGTNSCPSSGGALAATYASDCLYQPGPVYLPTIALGY
jgi:hypothetical protein